MKRLIASITAILAVQSTCEDCPCQYTIRNGSVAFTDALETYFLHVSNLTAASDHAWIPQAYASTPQDSHGPYGKLAELTNVVPNPISNIYDWGGPGLDGGSPGLHLWVRSSPVTVPPNPSRLIPIAEVVSQRSDILYGSFRVALRTPAVPGTCAAFFTYLNDTSEIDVELLSRQQQSSSSPSSPSSSSSSPSSSDQEPRQGKANLVIQSPQTAELGYVPASSPDFALVNLSSSPSSTYNEFRIDWLPGRVEFLVNGHSLKVMTANVPSAPARLHLIHWSDGNPGWSGGPPEKDAVLTVSYVKAYFNTSGEGQGVGKEGGKGCQGEKRVCAVPDVTMPPDPMGVEGNVTGRTPFVVNGSAGASPSVKKGSVGRNEVGAEGGWVVLVVVVWFAVPLW